MSGISATSTSSSKSPSVGFGSTSLERFLGGRDGEPKWLTDRRRSAFHRFLETPLPSLKEEEWRRTDIRSFKLDQFSPVFEWDPGDEESKPVAELWESWRETYGAGLVRLDGGDLMLESPKTDPRHKLPKGVVFCSLAEAVRNHAHLVQDRLGKAVGPDHDIFSALNSTYWSDGVFLRVPKGVKLEEPLFALAALSGLNNIADCSRVLVVLEEGAEATLVQESFCVVDPEAPALHCGAVELFIDQSAKLRFVNVQNWSPSTWCFSRERAILGRDASLEWTVGALGSKLTKANQEVALAGVGSHARVNGVTVTNNRQHLAYFTRQDHQAPRTTSDLLYKGGLLDKSRTVWKGMIRVEKDAQKTDAYQKNDNLILSDQARADSIPGLEIEANDVRCTHGATASQVDQDMVFYARSRGIDQESAMRLIVEGFFTNVYDRITVDSARESLRKAVERKLGRQSDHDYESDSDTETFDDN